MGIINVWTCSLASVFLVSIASLVGIFALLLRGDVLKKVMFFLVSFAVGGLFGDAFIHLLPESFEAFGFGLAVPFYILAGILAFFALEKFIRWRHCHRTPCEGHAMPLVFTNIVGDAVHNFVDGMLIGASYSVSIPIGAATTLAIILHEIPHELGNFGVLIHGGLSVKRALAYNFLSATLAIIGAIASLAIGPHIEGYARALIPITAGGFIYVAGSDLIPELQHDVKISTSLWQLTCIVLGLGLMAALAVVK